ESGEETGTPRRAGWSPAWSPHDDLLLGAAPAAAHRPFHPARAAPIGALGGRTSGCPAGESGLPPTGPRGNSPATLRCAGGVPPRVACCPGGGPARGRHGR